MSDLDGVDREILRLLLADARRSCRDIGLLRRLTLDFDRESVEPLAAADWRPDLGVTGGFGPECAVCGNEVGESGESVSVGTGDRYAVRRSSCSARVTEEYERLSEDGGGS